MRNNGMLEVKKDYINNDEKLKSLFSDDVFIVVFTGSRTFLSISQSTAL